MGYILALSSGDTVDTLLVIQYAANMFLFCGCFHSLSSLQSTRRQHSSWQMHQQNRQIASSSPTNTNAGGELSLLLDTREATQEMAQAW